MTERVATSVLAFAGVTLAVALAPAGASAHGPEVSIKDCFMEDASLAQANPLPCQSIPGGGTGVEDVVMSPDGRFVYVGNYGALGGSVTTFSRAADGKLTFAGCIAQAGSRSEQCATTSPTLGSVTSMALSPDGEFLYVGGYRLEGAGGAVTSFDRDPATGALTAIGCLGSAPCADDPQLTRFFQYSAMAVSPDGNSLYLHTDATILTVFNRNPATGALDAVQCFKGTASGAGCTQTAGLTGVGIDIVVSPDGKNVYTASGGVSTLDRPRSDAIASFTRAADGTLAALGCIQDSTTSNDACAASTPGLTSLIALAISPDGNNVYTGTHAQHLAGDDPSFRGGDSALVTFNRDAASGALSFAGCIEAPGESNGCTQTAPVEWVEDIEVHEHVWAAAFAVLEGESSGGPGLVRIARDSTTGALTVEGCGPRPFCNPSLVNRSGLLIEAEALVVAPDESSVYTAGDPAVFEWSGTVPFSARPDNTQNVSGPGISVEIPLETPMAASYSLTGIANGDGGAARAKAKPLKLKVEKLVRRDQDPTLKLKSRSDQAKALAKEIANGDVDATVKVKIKAKTMSGSKQKKTLKIKLR